MARPAAACVWNTAGRPTWRQEVAFRVGNTERRATWMWRMATNAVPCVGRFLNRHPNRRNKSVPHGCGEWRAVHGAKPADLHGCREWRAVYGTQPADLPRHQNSNVSREPALKSVPLGFIRTFACLQQSGRSWPCQAPARHKRSGSLHPLQLPLRERHIIPDVHAKAERVKVAGQTFAIPLTLP